MILLIGHIHVFVGVISSNNPIDAPILEDLDDSDNTIVDEGGNSGDAVNSICPVLDYESDGESIGLISDGSATPAAIYMMAPANTGLGPIDPNTQRTPDPTIRAPPVFGST
jgi:hypothetical protein